MIRPKQHKITYTQRYADWTNRTCNRCGRTSKAGESVVGEGDKTHSVVWPCPLCQRPTLTCFVCVEEISGSYSKLNALSLLMIRACTECQEHD